MNNTTPSEDEPSGMRHKVRRTLSAAYRFAARLLPGPRAWRGATWGVVLAAALLWTVMSAYASAPTGPLPFTVGLLGGLLAGALFGGIAMLVGGPNTARLPLSHFALLQPQVRARIGKASFMHAVAVSEAVFQTFEFRLGDFLGDNPAFDPAELVEVHFVFDRTPARVVILDEIGLRP